MSAPAPNQSRPAESASAEGGSLLAGLRAEIDRLDMALHDLLMERAEVVGRITAEAGKRGVALRPGREADILRGLLGRHRGAYPRRAVVRLWRELLAGSTTMQGPFVVATCEPEPGSGYPDLAREHFGMLTPLRVHRSAGQAIAEVAGGSATVAVLPLPVDEEPMPWWPGLLHRAEPRLHVVARLPFWAPRTEGASRAQALAVAAVPPDRSSQDCTLIGLELRAEQSRARLGEVVTAAGFQDARLQFRRDPHGGATQVLLAVAGFVAEDDPRLAGLADAFSSPGVLGAYAVPVEGDGP
jgi:chorismate mutase